MTLVKTPSLSLEHVSGQAGSDMILKREGGLRTRGSFKSTIPGKPLLTVITVVYNGEKYLEQAIQSVLAQTYDNVEYIIIDGGSTDGTLDIIRNYEERVDYWVSEPDEGIYDAMNKGISLASGELIGILNSDDWYSSYAIDSVIAAYKKMGARDIVIAGKWNVIFEGMSFKITVSPTLEFHRGMPIAHEAMFIAKSIYEKIGFYNAEYNYASDLDLLVRIFFAQIQIKFIEQILLNFRTTGITDKFMRKSGKEASSIVKKYFPLSIYIQHKITIQKWIFLTSLSKIFDRTLGHKTSNGLKKVYFKIKAAYNNNWKI